MAPEVTFITPARNEKFLRRTIIDALENSTLAVEVYAILDGYWPDESELVRDDRVHYLHRGQARGMRPAINSAVALAKGEFLFKFDSHCMFSDAFDAKLAEDCEDNWVVVPRRKRLDPEKWVLTEQHKPDVDYMYLSFPEGNDKGLNGRLWEERNRDEALRSVEIDDLMSAQGSAWFMRRSYYQELELLDDQTYGSFWNEFQEIGLKCWLSGGSVKVNKRCWYAHWHKTREQGGRGYKLDEKSSPNVFKWLGPVGSAWHKQTLPLSDLIERFWPVPTWPEDRALWGV